MSPRTLGLIEAAWEIEYGVKQAGRFEQATIEKLVRFYRSHGVRFLPPSSRAAGIRYQHSEASPPVKSAKS
jgi:hypothetical protein